jgi:hypothetical protein
MPKAPLTEEQKNALIERLKKAREAKQLEEEQKQEQKAKKEKKTKEKEVEEKPVLKPPVPEPPVPVKVATMPVLSEQPKAPVLKAQKSPKSAKPSKEKYAKLVFYKEPSSKKLKRMQSVLASSDDEDDEPKSMAVKPKVAVGPSTYAEGTTVDPNAARKLQYQKLSNLAHHFFDN